MCTLSFLEKIAPKKFLCRFNLRVGALIIALNMCVIMVICLIATAVQVSYIASEIKEDKETSTFTYRNSYAYSVIAVIYSLVLLCICIWFLYGVLKEKTTVILAWLVVCSIWLIQVLVCLLVLIYLHSLDAAFIAWLFALIFGILVIFILAYHLMVVLGYWLELKRSKNAEQS